MFLQYIRQFGRFQRNARLYLINTVLSGVTLGIILVLYNLYLVSLGYGTDFIGLVFFVTTVGAAIAIFPAGICVDRYSNKAILIWSSLLIGVAGAGQMLFRAPIPLLASVFFVGVGGAFLLVINAPFLTATSSPEERSSLFSLNIVLTLATTVVGEALGGALPIWFRSSSLLMAPLPSWCAGFISAQALPRSYQFALVLSGINPDPETDDRSFITLMATGTKRAFYQPAHVHACHSLDTLVSRHHQSFISPYRRRGIHGAWCWPVPALF